MTMRHTGLRHMPALDGLRAFAVVAVLLFHGEVSWMTGGYLGVDAFFVLSGFLITSLLLTEFRENGRVELRAFWIRRARRLLPALLLVLFGVALYAALLANPVELRQLRQDALSTFGYVANWNQIFSHQGYFESLVAPSPLRHTWSLAIEEQFYLVWPLLVVALLWLGRSTKRALFLVTAVLAAGSALLMSSLYSPGGDPSRIYYGTDTRAQSLLVGALLAVVLSSTAGVTRRASRTVLHTAAIASALALGWIWATTNGVDGWQYNGGFLLAALLVAVVITSVTQASDVGPLGRVMSFGPLCWIGMISYGLYLWHWPLYVVLTKERTGLDGTALLLVRLACTFAVATVSFYLLERPIRHGRLTGFRVRVALPAAATALVVAVVMTTSGGVPGQFKEVSASEIKVPDPVDVAGISTTARPLRVMLVGDSMARSLGWGFEREAVQGYQFFNAAVDGCGLAQDVGARWFSYWLEHDPRCVPGWRDRWPAAISQFAPDIVVALFGAQDTYDRRIDGREIPFLSPEGQALAQQDLQDAINVLSASGAHVVLLTTPYYQAGWPMRIDPDRSAFNPAWIDSYNRIQRTVASLNADRVSVLDLNKYIDPDGRYQKTVGVVTIRSFDNVHFSPEGAEFAIRWLHPQLDFLGKEHIGIAPSEPSTGVVQRS